MVNPPGTPGSAGIVGPGGANALAVSVVCPFFNEEAIIEAAIRRMVGNLDAQFGAGYELILVNDGSRDASLSRATALLGELQAMGDVVILTYPINQGRGRALKTGIEAARADIVVTTEVDCSWGDDIVQRLHSEVAAHPECDFVVASPHRAGGGLVNVSASRVLLTRLGNVLIRWFFNSNITMNTGMTRGYRRHVIAPLVTFDNGKEFHLEVLLKLLTLGFKVREIPATLTWLDHKLQREGSKKRKSSTRIWSTINSHLRFIAIAQPVRHFAILAAVAFLISAGFLSAAVLALIFKHVPAAFLAIVAILMSILGLLFSGMSIMFYQLREIMRDQWSRDFQSSHAPAARPATVAAHLVSRLRRE